MDPYRFQEVFKGVRNKIYELKTEIPATIFCKYEQTLLNALNEMEKEMSYIAQGITKSAEVLDI